MATKLQQMDEALRDVIESLEEDSLLVVMGDHGMTDDGNHGGASTQETEAALFLHSPRSPLVSLTPSGHPWLLDSEPKADIGRRIAQNHPWLLDSEPRADIGRRIAQVDLVPTLSLLLGLPIPFANLGAVVPELFTSLPLDTSATKEASEKKDSETGEEGLSLPALQSLCHSLYINARQVHRYLHKYASMASLPRQSLADLDAQFHSALATYTLAKSRPSTSTSTSGHLLSACRGFRAFLRDSLSLGRHVWTQYDVALMLWAVALLFASFLLLTRWLFLPSLPRRPAVGGFGRPLSALAIGVGLCLLGGGLLPGHFLSGNRTLAMPALLLLTLLLAQLGAPLAHLGEPLAKLGEPKSLPSRLTALLPWCISHWRGLACLVLVILHSIGLFSNSYIEAEHIVFHYLTCTALLLNLSAPDNAAGRVEGGKWGWKLKDLPWWARWMGPCLLQRLATGVRGHGQDVASYFNLSTSVGPLVGLLALYHATSPRARSLFVATSVYVGLMGHWLLHVEAMGHSLQLWLARAVLLSPLPALLLLHPPRLARASAKNAPASTPSSSLLLDVAMLLTGPLMLVLGPSSPLSLLCLLTELSLLSALLPRPSPSRNLDSALRIGVSLSFLARLGFYATGHHNQFNRLHYSAAFVASDEFHFMSGGALLMLNTFGTEVLLLTWAAGLFANADYGRGGGWGEEEGPRAAGVEGTVKETGKEMDRGKAGGVRTEGGGDSRGLKVGGDVALVLVWISSLRALLTAICVTVQRRHLMVWAIFAPKLIFESALHLVHVAVVVGLLFATRNVARMEGAGAKTRTA